MAPEGMASTKRSPKVSRISRGHTVAYARRKKPTPEGGDDDASDDEAPEAAGDAAGGPTADQGAPETATRTATKTAMELAAEGKAPPTPAPADVSTLAPTAPGASPIEPVGIGARAAPVAPVERPAPIDPPAPRASAPPDSASRPEPAEVPLRPRTDTVSMPPQAPIGRPPEMPRTEGTVEGQAQAGAAPSAPIPASHVDQAEKPTRMPGPREIPDGHPDDPASPPGSVPAGDSRSMRRRTDRYEFALVYRVQSFVISRFGVVGTRGQWRVVEYPTPASASHAYAKECSRFVSDGFSDYRE
jgi:hypothetical protein